ncbi:MAG: tetratricopeptide repeat protein [Planctomycetaceae bacterium]|nr:tetratricopeptide repeat protein [Planctomycetaceae bacterium]
MLQGVSEHSWLVIDEFLEAYDLAWNGANVPEIEKFVPDRDHPRYFDVLLELIRVDLELRWENGCPKLLDEYRSAFPECLNNATALTHVAFEEYRARRRAGEPVMPRDYAEQFGIATADWPVFQISGPRPSSAFPKTQIAAKSVDSILAPGALPWEFPQPGSELAGFSLLNELGRGAFSHVYLARQGDLANRLVVLKVSTESFAEAEKLAQLQHGNIVPIYSVHRAGPFSAVCMPYFGATTLADVIRESKNGEVLPVSGQKFFETLANGKHTTQRTRPESTKSKNDALTSSNRMPEPLTTAALTGDEVENASTLSSKAFAGLTYVEAVLWIGARLTEGLSHAHHRGILHHDLKPANVLLSDAGQPMLLDFNLSEDTKLRSFDRHAIVGGTLPYMAPEQLVAFRDGIPGGDARTDLYSLGVILFELLTGRLPYPVVSGSSDKILGEMLRLRLDASRDVRRLNPAVTFAVESIIRRCLAPDPNRRYQTAEQLLEDLERQLSHRPLRHAHEPSFRERIQKWIRRHPRLTSATGIVIVATCLIASLGAMYQIRTQRLAQLEAVESLHAFESDMQSAQVQCLEARVSGAAGISAVKTACQQALNRFHVLDHDHWQQDQVVSLLSSDQRSRLSAEVGELLFLTSAMSRLEAESISSPIDKRAALDQALQLIERAAACFPADETPLAMAYQQGLLLQQMGERPEEARLLLAAPSTGIPRSARDSCMLACLFQNQRRFREALPLWKHATEVDPQNVWAWYGLGNCHARLSQPANAVACFSVCIALRPEIGDWYFHRGVANLELQDFTQASSDFSNTLRCSRLRMNLIRDLSPRSNVSFSTVSDKERKPADLEALVNRGISQLGRDHVWEAVADLTAAIQQGKQDGRVYLILAQALEKTGDTAGAKQARQQALDREPTDAEGWIAQGVTLVATDPKGAIRDFDRALALQADSLAALESKAHVLSEKLNQHSKAVLVLDHAVDCHPEECSIIAARGVLLARLGRRDLALQDAERALQGNPSASIQFQVAGIYAQTSKQVPNDRARAVSLLASALRQGIGTNLVDADHDLDPIRQDPQFQQVVQAVRILMKVTQPDHAPPGTSPKGKS